MLPEGGRRSLLVVISGPTGSGKTTIARRIVEECPGAVFSVSHTTRSIRPGEKDGVDYHFVMPGEFEKKAAGGEFLEHARVHNHSYGTHRSEWERARAAGKDLVLDIDVQGGMQVLRSFADATLIFVIPPSFEELMERLRKRGEEKSFDLGTRLKTALSELDFAGEYHYNIVNEDLSSAVERVKEILVVNRLRSSFSVDFRKGFKESIENFLRERNV